jgi:Asp-tRNA(Asn)/Glu-tRNA(Gln) amidotransferase B subunit
MEWETVIGLEIHAQLATRSKIFSGAATAYGAPPNAQTDLIDLAYPGVLPVLNGEAVRMAVKFGLAINARVMRRSIFARKNYFYPDLPKGYQISQFELPIVCGGAVDIVLEDGSSKRIEVTRAHLEEDAGKSAWTSIAPVRHSSRSSPNRRCARPGKRSPISRKCTPWCATWLSATATCRKARSAATPTCRCA